MSSYNNPENVRMFVDGKEISTPIQELGYVYIKPEVSPPTVPKSFFATASRETTFEFTDAILNSLSDAMPNVDLEVTHILKPLPRKPKSKKKRIQKKWNKRYEASTAKTTYENVRIEAADSF